MAFNNPLFDQIREQILRDYRSTFPLADTSKGSIIYADASAVASAVWGLYKNQNWLRSNMVPDAPSREILERWARIYGIQTSGKTDSEILEEFIERLRRPAAGGNKADVERWAKQVSSKGLLDFPLKRDVPATISNNGLSNFNAANFTDGDELKTAFSTGGAAAGANFVLDYGDGLSEDLVSLGMWKYNEENLVFQIEYSDDGAIWTEIVGSFVLEGLGWSFSEWDSVGPRRFWRVSLVNTTTNDVNVGEVEFYSAGTEVVNSAICYPNYLAIGTFHLVASRNSTRISNKLLEAIFEYLDFRLPISPKEFFVVRPKDLSVEVSVEVTGEAANLGIIETEIRNYIAGLSIEEPFYIAQITLICLQNGATNASVILPTADVYPGAFEQIIEDSIQVVRV